MTGETLALLAALAYGAAGLSIVRGKAAARGDNGVFLSVLVTAALSLALWLGWGQVSLGAAMTAANMRPLLAFVLAGVASIALGRALMYRATESIGAVRASLLRRLTPVFALPCAFFLLGELPDAQTLLGGVLILAGVAFYLRRSGGRADVPAAGLILGAGSALFYALAYALRRLGLETLPDAAFGALVGAVAGGAWVVAAAAFGRRPVRRLRGLIADRGLWHWFTAVMLSIGQVLQFFALKSASVAVVAVLGALEVFFSALLVMVFLRSERVAGGRLLIAALMAVAGTAVLVL